VHYINYVQLKTLIVQLTRLKKLIARQFYLQEEDMLDLSVMS